ncbi:cell division protein FtsA [Candidatus Peregrinibacteria bacterium]|nr:MAG: cell division protein FtsA [Candidatus Peregrinibacteria bacterium]
MAKEQIVAGLDIGSSKIRTVIAMVEPDKKIPNIIGVGVSPSTGMRKGNVIDVDETISNISAALEDAERMSGAPVHHVFVSLNGDHIESFDSRGVIAISHAGSEIIEEDVNRVLEAAQAVSMPANRRILRIIPKSFSIDDQRGIKNPVGMVGVRLEVDAHIITGQSTIIKILKKQFIKQESISTILFLARWRLRRLFCRVGKRNWVLQWLIWVLAVLLWLYLKKGRLCTRQRYPLRGKCHE